MKLRVARVLTPVALLSAAPAAATTATIDQNHGLRGTAPYDAGLYVAFCPGGHAQRAWPAGASEQPAGPPGGEPSGASEGESSGAGGSELSAYAGRLRAGLQGRHASAASTSEAGWPAKQCLKMDKGGAGRRHTLVGLDGVHNWLLGGYGNDTIVGGDRGDVIWADYHPRGEPRWQTAQILAGNGRNVIYANDTRDYVWTGTNPHTVVHAHVSGISGVIHCQSPGIVVYLSTASERRFALDGCRHVSHFSVGY